LQIQCGSWFIRLAVPGLVAENLLLDEEETNVALKITNREVNGVSVVALDGRIVLGDLWQSQAVSIPGFFATNQFDNHRVAIAD
jgi:hypothetical protein